MARRIAARVVLLLFGLYLADSIWKTVMIETGRVKLDVPPSALLFGLLVRAAVMLWLLWIYLRLKGAPQADEQASSRPDTPTSSR